MMKKVTALLGALLLLGPGYGTVPEVQYPPAAFMGSQTDGHTKEATPEQKPEETPAPPLTEAEIAASDIKEFGDEASAVFERDVYGVIRIQSMRVATLEETAQAIYTPEECLELHAKWEARTNGSTVTKINMKYINREDGSLFTGPAYRVDDSQHYKWQLNKKTLVYVLNPYGGAEMVNGKLLVRVRLTYYDASVPSMDMLALYTGYRSAPNPYDDFQKEYFMDPDTLERYEYLSMKYLDPWRGPLSMLEAG